MTAAATLATVAGHRGEHEALSAPDLSDVELVHRARDGDHDAFHVLFRRHERRVYGLAMRLLRNPEWARDAVQESFVKAYRALRKFEGRSAFGTWMYRLTYNQCLDMRRSDRSGRYDEWDEERLSGSAGDASAAPGLASSIPGPVEEVERAEVRERISKAVEALPETLRETLVMREFDGLAYAEIAKLQKIPKGTVMSRLFHARRRLQEALGEQGIGPSTSASETSEERT